MALAHRDGVCEAGIGKKYTCTPILTRSVVVVAEEGGRCKFERKGVEIAEKSHTRVMLLVVLVE